MSSTMNRDEGTPVDIEIAAAGTVMEDREIIAIRDAENVRSPLLGAPNPTLS